MSWFFLTIISTLLLALFVFSSKVFLNRPSVNPRLYAGLVQLLSGLWCIPVIIATGFDFRPPAVGWWLLILVAATYTVSATLYYTGLQKIDLSKATILESVAVFWAIIYGFLFFSESVTLPKAAAAILVFFAVLLVSGKINFRSWDKYELYIIASTAFFTLGGALDKYLVRYSPGIVSYVALAFILPGLLMTAINLPPDLKKSVKSFSGNNFWKFILLNSFFSAAAYVIQYRAYNLGGEISAMYPIIQSQSVILPFMGIIFLKEKKNLRQKLSALVLVLFAYYLIRP